MTHPRTAPLLLATAFAASTLMVGCQSDNYEQSDPPQTTVIHQNPKKKSAIKYAEPDAHESDKD